MRNKRINMGNLICLLLMITFVHCQNNTNGTNENTVEPDVQSTVTGELIVNQEVASRVKIEYNSFGQPQVTENGGLYIVDIIENGEELWFHFIASRGELYKIWWQDSWWDQYTAGSIFVTAYEDDQKTVYFPENRLIQMIGSPKVISVANDGEVYLKVRGYDDEIDGTFAINVEKLDKESAIPIAFGSPEFLSISAGEVKLCAFQVEQDALYTVTIEGSEYVGAYGDQVDVNVSAIRENMNDYYFYEEPADSPVWGYLRMPYFKALKTEIVYLSVIGAYWWEPRDVIITVTRNLNP